MDNRLLNRLKRRDFRFDLTLNGYISKNLCMVVGSREELFKFPYIKDYEFTDLISFLDVVKIFHPKGLPSDPLFGWEYRDKDSYIAWVKGGVWNLNYFNMGLSLIKAQEIGFHKEESFPLLIRNENEVCLITVNVMLLDVWKQQSEQIERESHIIPFNEISITKAQIREFLDRLSGYEGCQYNGVEWRCGGPEFNFSRKIMNLMKIPSEEQTAFIALCKNYGGYCDCEILMNAAPHLLNEEASGNESTQPCNKHDKNSGFAENECPFCGDIYDNVTLHIKECRFAPNDGVEQYRKLRRAS
ncbi:MAG: DUF2695 domain-containing protein [Promethearchaeota archaeon]|jgi:hypothetical protein